VDKPSETPEVKPNMAGQAWLDGLPDPLVAIDAQGRLEWANRAASALFGQPVSAYRGRSVLDLIHPDDLHFALMSLDSLQTKDVGSLIEIRVQAPGGWRLVEAVGSNCMGVAGIDCLIITFRDLTERRRWEVGRSNDAAFRAVVHNAASLLMLVDHDGTLQAISGAVTRLLGLDPEALEKSRLLDLIDGPDVGAVRQAFETCRSDAAGDLEPVTVEAGLRDRDGRPVPFELTLVDMADDPTVPGIVISGHNITKLRAFQKALADLAHKDPLTSLFNRAAVDTRLEALLQHKRRVAVAFVDLDGFKLVNDRYGHHFGDQVLCAVARRLTETVRPSDLVGRYGGDEFVVVAQEVTDGADLDGRLAAAMADPVQIGGRDLVVRASVGMTYTEPEDTLTSVLIRADRAMYGLKSKRSLRIVG
jgi:diguanylate cyclase (GGDEF)-like protein/PAS domain S-box-containing protein